MDLAQIAYLQKRYAQMSDEDLATLYVTRRSALSEEAVEALQRVLDRRDVSAFIRETQAKADDLNAQAAAAEEELQKQRAASREIPRAMLILVVAAVVIFLVMALVRRLA